MRFTWPAVYAMLFIYRSIASIFSIGIVAAFTTLGDSHSFMALDPETFAEKSGASFREPGWIVFSFGYALRRVIGDSEYLLSIGYQCIAFVGIVMLLSSLAPDFRRRIALLFFLPSFTIWTSIGGKETFIVFFVCLILKGLSDWAHRRTVSIWQIALAFAGLIIFKPHFFAAVLFLLGIGIVIRYFPGRETVVFVCFAITVIVLFLIRPILEDQAPHFFVAHFTGDQARSTRPPFWTDPGDFFAKSPEGMFLAFFGPTLAEARVSIVHLFTLVESAILLAAFGIMLLRELPRTPGYAFFLGLGTLFWTLFPNYGAGVMNPGTAIRYRAGWIPIVFFCIAVLMTERFGRMLIESRNRRRVLASASAPVSREQPA